jgi:hypothetical protein
MTPSERATPPAGERVFTEEEVFDRIEGRPQESK